MVWGTATFSSTEVNKLYVSVHCRKKKAVMNAMRLNTSVLCVQSVGGLGVGVGVGGGERGLGERRK